jgi:hypothetical protein
MNYSNFEDFNENINDNINDINITDNSAKNLLDDYEILKKSLNDLKKDYTDLINKKEIYDNYLNNLLNNHLNIANIINNDNLSNSFNEYQKKIKENYEKWIINDYIVKIKTIEENIETIELKLKDFTHLFIYIINNIIGDKEISKNMCPICFENPIDICLNPCGHTTCNKCIISNRRNTYNNDKCYICRTPINDYIKIYFSI